MEGFMLTLRQRYTIQIRGDFLDILFMGTPDFAVFSLEALLCAGHNIVGIVTQPDKPVGRGYKITPPPVKNYALKHNIPVTQPNTLRGEELQSLLSTLEPEMIVVAAYGKILPELVLNYPRYGCLCVHASLLPKYRGAAPIQRAIISGESKTGVTIMYMDKGIDTGDMLEKAEIDITEDDNFKTVHDKLGRLGAELLCKVILDIEKGIAVRTVQDSKDAIYADKIAKKDGLIDFSRKATEIQNQVKGLSPFPLAFTHTLDGKMLKIIKSVVSSKDAFWALPGTVVSLECGIEIACGEGTLTATEVIPEGRGKMSASDYIRGKKISIGDVLGKQTINY